MGGKGIGMKTDHPIRAVARTLAAAVLALAVTGCASLEALFAPDARPWGRWNIHDPESRGEVDHRVWNRFLRTYVAPDDDGVNRVAYRRITPEHRRALKDYLASLTRTRVSRLSRAEQFPYWINLYNALTVNLVVTFRPADSIRDIDLSPWYRFYEVGPWDRKLVTVEGIPVSLNDIEHRILRPLWRDPRLHYALNCAAVGCPNLQSTAFTATNTEAMLEAAARVYVNSPRGVRIDDGDLIVSSIYNWFADDFGGTDRAVIGHLRKFAEPRLKTTLGRFRAIDGYAYDWRLNGAR